MTSTRAGPIICWGEVLWDRFPTGHTLGGAPANVAYHLAALGAEVDLVSRVGDDDDGRRASVELERAGVGVELIQIDRERSTGEVGVEVAADGDAVYALRPDRAWEHIECGPAERSRLAAARAISYGTLAQRSADGQAAHSAALASLPASAARVCDPNLRSGFDDWPLLEKSLAAATIVKINEHEARAIEEQLAGKASASEYLLECCGVELVAITRGADGCTLHRGSDASSCPGFPAERKGDNVGCGDAFVAVLTIAALCGWSLERTATAACRYAASVAAHRGATPPIDRALIAKLSSEMSR